jgi:O-antigen ligase
MTDRSARFLWAAPFFAAGPAAALAPRSLLTVLLVACASGMVIHGLRRQHLSWPSLSTAMPFGLFVLYAGLSASWSIIPGSTLNQFLKLIYLLAAAFLSAGMLSAAPPQARQAASLGLIAGLAVGFALLLFDTAAGYPLLGAMHGTDGSGYVGDPAVNRTLVAFAALIWPAALALNGRVGAWSLILPAGFLALSLFATSQSATFGIAVGFIAYAITCLSIRTGRRLATAMLIVGLLGAVPIARIAYSTGLSEAAWLPHSAQHRIEVWKFAADRIMRRPLLGFGLDASRALPNEGDVSKFRSWTDRVIPLHPHSVFLQLWLELGVVGAALGFAVGVILLRAADALDHVSQAFVLAAFACNLAMAGVTSFSMWQGWWTSALIVSALCLLPSVRPATPAIDKGKADP